ncbi:MAG: hypothetical protein HYX74_12255 [Acidobacteria bacterium]|nr:hypothetical protein [Acidobacteriota bacterium]
MFHPNLRASRRVSVLLSSTLIIVVIGLGIPQIPDLVCSAEESQASVLREPVHQDTTAITAQEKKRSDLIGFDIALLAGRAVHDTLDIRYLDSRDAIPGLRRIAPSPPGRSPPPLP